MNRGTLAIVLSLIVGCSGTPAPRRDPPTPVPSALVLPISATPRSLNPLGRDPAALPVLRFILDGLVRIDGASGAPVPALAESWEIDETGRIYSFRLREGAAWSDGTAFGPEDVIFTLNDLAHSPGVTNPYREYLRIDMEDGDAFPRVEARGERDVRIILPRPHPPLLRALAHVPILPRHRLESDLKAGLITFSWRSGDSPTRVAGTGPFTLEEIVPGEEVRLRRNPHYWEADPDGGRLPRLDRVIFRVVRGDPVAAFLQGRIDFTVLDPRQALEIRNPGEVGPYRLHRSGPLGESTFLAFRHGEEGLPAIFGKVEFRHAVSHALDRDRMIHEILQGQGRQQWSPISPASPAFHHPDVRTYPHDLHRAMDLLDRLELLDRNRDGTRETPRGTPLSIEILHSRTRNTGDIARRIAADLRRIGIQGKVREASWQEIGEAMAGRKWDALVLTIPEAYDPQLLERIWTSQGSMRYWRPPAEGSAAPWEAEVDDLFRKGRETTGDPARYALYRRFQEIASEQIPLIFTVQRVLTVAIRSRVENFDPSPAGHFHNMARIDVTGE